MALEAVKRTSNDNVNGANQNVKRSGGKQGGGKLEREPQTKRARKRVNYSIPTTDYQGYQEYLATQFDRVTLDGNLLKVEGSGRGPGQGGGGRTGQDNGDRTGQGNRGKSGRGKQGGGASRGGLDYYSSDGSINLAPEIGEAIAEELLQSTKEAKIKGDKGCV